MNRVMAFISGLLFGLGLILAGMTDPGKVLGFLDLFGLWDPSLALVMGGAVAVGMIGFRLTAGRTHSLLGEPMRLPAAQQIDTRLLTGAAVFGVGWGLAGFCPGPALVSVGAGEWKAVAFTLAMMAGMALHDFLAQRGQDPFISRA